MRLGVAIHTPYFDVDPFVAPAINMGPPIHTEEREFCPFVSRDGKCLFFTRTGKIFWVHTHYIDQLKKEILNNPASASS